jgi:hypothetical protein
MKETTVNNNQQGYTELVLKVYITEEKRFLNGILTIKEGLESSIRLRFENYDSGYIECDYIYCCLRKLHEEFDKMGIKLMCNGFRKDVRPSAMSLDMGGGRKAYLHVLGERNRPTIVDIFDATDNLNALGTVAESEEYYVLWLKS